MAWTHGSTGCCRIATLRIEQCPGCQKTGVCEYSLPVADFNKDLEPSERTVTRMVERDYERFRLLYPDTKPDIAADYDAPLAIIPTRVLIGRVAKRLKENPND